VTPAVGAKPTKHYYFLSLDGRSDLRIQAKHLLPAVNATERSWPANPSNLQTLSVGEQSQMIGAKEQGRNVRKVVRLLK
jgi:hypothetical protein